jgi:hypothetical protein
MLLWCRRCVRNFHINFVTMIIISFKQNQWKVDGRTHKQIGEKKMTYQVRDGIE